MYNRKPKKPRISFNIPGIDFSRPVETWQAQFAAIGIKIPAWKDYEKRALSRSRRGLSGSKRWETVEADFADLLNEGENDATA